MSLTPKLPIFLETPGGGGPTSPQQMIEAMTGRLIHPITLGRTWSTQAGNYTLTTTDDCILADVSGGSITLTLPTAVAATNRYTIKLHLGGTGNTCTINTIGGQTIDGAATLVLVGDNDSVDVSSDQTNWQIT